MKPQHQPKHRRPGSKHLEGQRLADAAARATIASLSLSRIGVILGAMALIVAIASLIVRLSQTANRYLCREVLPGPRRPGQ